MHKYSTKDVTNKSHYCSSKSEVRSNSCTCVDQHNNNKIDRLIVWLAADAPF